MIYVTFQAIRDRLSASSPREVPITPDLREAAVVLVLVPPEDAGLRALFIKRAEHPGDPWSGQMAFPGGRRDPTDATLLATATREAREETGLDLSPADHLGQLNDLSPVSQHLPQIVVRPFVFGLSTMPTVHSSPEVALHLWAGLDELRESRVTETVHVRGQDLVVPGYRVGAHLIWGMTERILTPFMELLRRS